MTTGDQARASGWEAMQVNLAASCTQRVDVQRYADGTGTGYRVGLFSYLNGGRAADLRRGVRAEDAASTWSRSGCQDVRRCCFGCSPGAHAVGSRFGSE